MSNQRLASAARDLPQAFVDLSPTQDSVLTGEAVALELQSASVLTRAISVIIDAVLYVAVGGALALLLQNFADNQAQVQTISIVTIACTVLVLPVLIETLTRGLSVGRIAMGTRVVRDDGGAIHFRHALVRGVVGVFELWVLLGSLALIAGVLNRQSKRLGDMLAGTYVVRLRGTEEAITPLLMPHELQGWAQAADMAAVPNHLALAGRRFLARTGTLNEHHRYAMGLRLAQEITPYVFPAPPAGTHPERFLAAVLVARRDREFAAYQRSASTRRSISEQIEQLGYGQDATPQLPT